MHTTIVVKRPHSIEWPNRLGLLERIEHHIGHHRRARFLFGMGRIPLPTAVGNDVDGARLIHQRDALAFLDGDAALGKVGTGQANSVAGRTGTRGASPLVVVGPEGLPQATTKSVRSVKSTKILPLFFMKRCSFPTTVSLWRRDPRREKLF